MQSENKPAPRKTETNRSKPDETEINRMAKIASAILSMAKMAKKKTKTKKKTIFPPLLPPRGDSVTRQRAWEKGERPPLRCWSGNGGTLGYGCSFPAWAGERGGGTGGCGCCCGRPCRPLERKAPSAW